MGKESRRLRRQFEALARAVPPARWFVDRLLGHNMRLVRVPTALVLILGGVASILPVLGIWMLPLGLMLLAVDIPVLQPLVSSITIRVRRRITVWRTQRRRALSADRRRRRGLPPVATSRPPLD
jgi:hypothetical protein